MEKEDDGDGAAHGLGPRVKHPLCRFLLVGLFMMLNAMTGLGPNVNNQFC